MRDKKISLSIPRPCAEKWSSFEKTDEGGYCSSCSKVVIDFTKMSDEEIVSYFQTNRSHTCGRFLPQQIKQYPVSKSKWNLMPRLSVIKAGALTLGMLFMSREMSGVPRSVATEVTEPRKEDIKSIPDTPVMKFRGRCIDEYDNSALPGVNVVIKGTTTGTVTDMNGYFQLDVSEGDVLVFTFIGLRTKEYTVTRNMKADFVMEFEMIADLTGEVAVDGIYSSTKGGWWSKIKALF